jgi:hypothetical protein
MKFRKILVAGALALCLGSTGVRAQSANPIVSNLQTTTTSVAALPSAALYVGAVLKADYGNAGIIYVGPCSNLTTATGYPLKAGEAISYGVTNLSAVCMIGQNTTDVLHYTGN